MNRRDTVLALLALGAANRPLTSFAQQQIRIWRVGVLVTRSKPDSLESENIGGFLKGMRELGYVEGRNVVIEWRFGDNNVERLRGLAAELVRLNVDVIVAGASPATGAAQRATSSIPVVMASVTDPVAAGFVKNLARPEGNITGLTTFAGDVGPKNLELLLDLLPKLSRVAVLLNPGNVSASAAILKEVQVAANKAGIVIVPAEAQSPQEIDAAFSLMTRERAGAVIVASDPLFVDHRHRIASLAMKNRLPSMGPFADYAEAGCLMSYGQNRTEIYRRAATYVDKILKGAKPRDLPVEQPSTFEFIINRRTAKAIGIVIPPSFLVRADRVIE